MVPFLGRDRGAVQFIGGTIEDQKLNFIYMHMQTKLTRYRRRCGLQCTLNIGVWTPHQCILTCHHCNSRHIPSVTLDGCCRSWQSAGGWSKRSIQHRTATCTRGSQCFLIVCCLKTIYTSDSTNRF